METTPNSRTSIDRANGTGTWVAIGLPQAILPDQLQTR